MEREICYTNFLKWWRGVYNWASECVLFLHLNKAMPGILETDSTVLQAE